jgi:AcrR family transcriptional regulator
MAASKKEGPVTVPGRPPKQDRSRASFERMIAAAEALMVERGSDDFTLLDVSRVGKVSIGSIYNRFSGKEELVQAVHARMMTRLTADRARMVMNARERSSSLIELIPALIEEMGETLRRHASILRPMMLRAAHDSKIQELGKRGYIQATRAMVEELLQYRDQIRHPDPDHACEAAVNVAYAAFARELGFGMAELLQPVPEWNRFKQDVARMVAAFLLFEPNQ